MHTITKADIPHIVSIMNGLLASGHYTEPLDRGGGMSPAPINRDMGKEWKNDGWAVRRMPEAVADAIDLYETLFRQVEIQIEEGEE